VGRVVASVRPIDLRLPSPLEELRDDRITAAGLRLFLKREDLISPDIPGNKWRKLKYNLEAAQKHGDRALLTFGGAYSNHIRATAAAGYYFGFETVGVIRGEEHLPLNPSLEYAVRHGMRLAYLDRATYREKMSPEVIAMLRRRFGEFWLLPEGGSNAGALRGCAEIPGEIARGFDLACCPCGTGGTLAGLAHGLGPGQRALGFSALKGGEFLSREVAALQREAFGAASGNWSIEYGFHFGGFARRSPALGQFVADFKERHALSLDWVYVARMMYGIFALAQQGGFPAGTVIMAVITGGAGIRLPYGRAGRG
jgi:1-aminocyclopropane-1-carboxylate deaminase